jgi:hypothetical protein
LDAIKPDYPAMLRDCVTVTAAARPFSALPSIPEDRLTLDRAHVELALQEMTDLCSKAKVARSKGDTATMTADLYQAGLRVGDAGHYLSLLEVDGPKTTSKPSP